MKMREYKTQAQLSAALENPNALLAMNAWRLLQEEYCKITHDDIEAVNDYLQTSFYVSIWDDNGQWIEVSQDFDRLESACEYLVEYYLTLNPNYEPAEDTI